MDVSQFDLRQEQPHGGLLDPSNDIENIARECKIAKGSMYQYFENKRDMYLYVINEAIRLSLEIVKDINFEEISLFDFAEKSFELSWNFMVKNPHVYSILEKSAFYDDSPYRDEIQNLLKGQTKTLLYEIIIKNQSIMLKEQME